MFRRSNSSSGGSGCDETVPLNGPYAVVNGGGTMEDDDYDEDDDQEVTINGQPVKTTVYECSGLASTEVLILYSGLKQPFLYF